MSFNILYVENDDDDYEEILHHINEYNKEKEDRLPLRLERARDPDELENKLDVRHRIVLADIYYDNPNTGKIDADNRLNDIKRIVENWSEQKNGGRSIPLIAFSRRETQEATLADSDELFDIWDKNTASPRYVTWRLANLAQEMSRSQPDSYLQCLIRNMDNGPSWHDQVKQMAQKYNSGWTEFDQIDKAGTIITEIAQKLSTGTQCEEMWKIMTEWEALGRAISPNTRGHSRHVINVFWLGYYIINHENMKGMFNEFWSKLLLKRGGMEDIGDAPPIEAINNTWFYTGLFHDVCACIEESKKLTNFHQKLYGKFKGIGINSSPSQQTLSDEIKTSVKDILQEIANPLNEDICPLVEKSITKNEPDHGIIGAIYLTKTIQQTKQKSYAREAARAVIVHNIIGDFENSINTQLSWENEPFACLLALCDQLQTWDRERGDDTLSEGSDLPVRAELLDLQIGSSVDTTLCINISINYITRRHVEKNSVIRERVEDKLKKILQANPYKALEKIMTPWPFQLRSKFYLNRNHLTTLSF